MTLVEETPDPSRICTIQPRNVMENRSFLVDTSKLRDINDLLADDSGSWINNGQHKFHYEQDSDGVFQRVGRRASFNTSLLREPWVTLYRHYYDNRDSKDSSESRDFHRIISFVTGRV